MLTNEESGCIHAWSYEVIYEQGGYQLANMCTIYIAIVVTCMDNPRVAGLRAEGVFTNTATLLM